MESRAPECPSCGSDRAELVETVWESGPKDPESSLAPPVPRKAATNLGRFYRWGIFWLMVTLVVTLILRNHAAHRVESVLEVTLLGICLGIYQVIRLFTSRPRPTEDQEAALTEWHAAHAEWERMRVCQDCGTTFTPSD